MHLFGREKKLKIKKKKRLRRLGYANKVTRFLQLIMVILSGKLFDVVVKTQDHELLCLLGCFKGTQDRACHIGLIQ
jgi:hypothetical protein